MRIHEYGDASVIRAEDVPRPAPGSGEVLVRVAGTSFNPSDVGVRRGLLRSVFPIELPYTLGGEVAGTVVEAGAGVRTLVVGDAVVGRVDSGGAAAEFVTVAADALVAAPAGIPLAHAAALPIAGLTAWQAVFDHAGLAPGMRVLINGAGGGVGGFAVQLAKHVGAHVIATAGPRSAGTVRRFGADQIVDYTTTPLAAALDEPVDVVIHLVPDGGRDIMTLVRPGGLVVSATGPVNRPAGEPVKEPAGEPVEKPAGEAVRAVHFVARNDTTQLAALVGLIDAGVVQVDVAVRPLTDLAAVHREAEAGRVRGKTVLTP